MYWHPLHHVVSGVICKEVPLKNEPPRDAHKFSIQFHHAELEHWHTITNIKYVAQNVAQVMTLVRHVVWYQQRWMY